MGEVDIFLSFAGQGATTRLGVWAMVVSYTAHGDDGMSNREPLEGYLLPLATSHPITIMPIHTGSHEILP